MITEIDDVALDPHAELGIVHVWWMAISHERTALKRITRDLSAEALADEDIRQHLLDRLEALERSDSDWLAFAESSFERRVQRVVGAETQSITPGVLR